MFEAFFPFGVCVSLTLRDCTGYLGHSLWFSEGGQSETSGGNVHSW